MTAKNPTGQVLAGICGFLHLTGFRNLSGVELQCPSAKADSKEYCLIFRRHNHERHASHPEFISGSHRNPPTFSLN